MIENIYKVESLTKEYGTGEAKVTALDSANTEIFEGELVIVLGPSASGKSTLLNIMGGMDTPSSGKVFFKGQDIAQYGKKQLAEYRRNSIGFVFQFYNLMPNLTARENVELATEISPTPLNIDEVLRNVGLFERADHFPTQMSGGEQQRVAIARAVAKNPDVLLCDEPTGALDYTTGKMVLKLLRDINRKTGKTVLIITHNQAISAMADRIIKLRSGRVTENITNPNPVDPETIEW